MIDLKSLKCPGCGAPYEEEQERCPFCGAILPQAAAAEQLANVAASDGSEDIVDYYALFGLSMGTDISEMEIQEGVLRAQQQHLLNPYIDKQRRQEMINDLEVGGWILADARARREYDGLLSSLSTGLFTEKHLGTLADVQRRAREALGLEVDHTSPEELLQQGIGYQALGMHREAADVLRRAVAEMPDSAEAQYRYAQALLSSGDPLAKGSHELRQAAEGFKTAAQLDATLLNAAAYEALCRGLLAREEGDIAQAQQHLRQSVSLDVHLGVAWRALAALSLRAGDDEAVFQHCRRAIHCDPKDEQAYLFLVASCWRTGKKEWARDAANRVAALRGAAWNADKVLREIL